MWRFDVVPDSGPARASWPNAAKLPISDGAFWTPFTYDEANGILYDSGTVRWKFAAPRPVLAGVTPSAGGLVFNADLGGQLRAFDADSGTVLCENTGQSTGGGILTYVAGGRQLLAVASG